MRPLPWDWHPAFLNGIIRGMAQALGPLIPVHQQDDYDLNRALADANTRLDQMEGLDFYFTEKLTPMKKLEAVQQLHYWRVGGDSFTCMLYTMFQKADPSNRTRLAIAFPVEDVVFIEWKASADEKEFFAKYGIQL